MVVVCTPVRRGNRAAGARFRVCSLPFNQTLASGPLGCRVSGALPRTWAPAPAKLVIWLILPVVICLSQRLSHACLSISNLYCETANGSLNQLSFI